MSISVLAGGQSFMEGMRGPAPFDYSSESDFRAWNYTTDAWGNAQLGVNPFVDSVGGIVPNNMAFAFCRHLSIMLQTGVHLVLLAESGVSIEYFLPNISLVTNNWTNIDDGKFGASGANELLGTIDTCDARQALATLDKPYFDLMLWHQGETNISRGDSRATYQAKQDELLIQMDDRDIIRLGTTKILLGKISTEYTGYANQHNAVDAIAAKYDKVATVPWDNFEVVGGGDKHTTGRGIYQHAFGYWDAFRTL